MGCAYIGLDRHKHRCSHTYIDIYIYIYIYIHTHISEIFLLISIKKNKLYSCHFVVFKARFFFFSISEWWKVLFTMGTSRGSLTFQTFSQLPQRRKSSTVKTRLGERITEYLSKMVGLRTQSPQKTIYHSNNSTNQTRRKDNWISKQEGRACDSNTLKPFY